jgi:hypothetical protein
VPSEAEGVVHDDFGFLLPRFLWDVIQITIRIGFFEVEGGGKEIGFEGLKADCHLDGSGGTEEVADSAIAMLMTMMPT